MIPALLGLIAPVAAVKVLSGLVRAAGAALRSATAPAALPVPPVVEKAAEVSEQVSDSPVIFAYDGMSRRTKITELTNGTVTSKKLYWWLGGTIVCERDGLQTGFPITKRYFGQGLVQGVTKLFYTFDHLGSVRELVDDAGTVQAQYRYSTYGERTKESGNLDSDWGYAGLWHHAPSGLDLATYRLYDAKNRRWISRDPLGEGVDYNVYRYVNNNPIGFVDPLGLKKKCIVYVIYTWVPPSRGDYHTTLYVECFDDGKRTLDRYDFGPTKTGYCGSYGVSDMSGSGPGVGELHRRPDKSPDTSLGKLQNSKNAELHMLPAPPDVNQRFQNASNQIENNHVQYHTLGHNSNSAAEFLLNSAAMRLPAPGPGINVPHTPMMGP